MDVELVATTAEDRPVLANLLQLYLHDFSEFQPIELTAHGTYDYPYLDRFFGDPDREAYLIRVGGRPAGFVLARCDIAGDDGAWNVSEFFVVRGQRGKGVAGAAARLLFQRHPGMWTLSYLQQNAPAARLWPAVVASVAEGPVARVEQLPPAVTEARYRLRFEVAAGSSATEAVSGGRGAAG
ncbi:GNAT family N-acetyltransferase [Kitasatospora sp. NBC_01266]|uniref:GNAT family N-acetyltransferase n=1 Tax=Kitasatospora sp. NBC_01266 TaxID=2903572 RepID=UPI002E313D60|nr:GNAT family N-acetyltransferase [Kitasatospora sp. NBC_01266]